MQTDRSAPLLFVYCAILTVAAATVCDAAESSFPPEVIADWNRRAEKFPGHAGSFVRTLTSVTEAGVTVEVVRRFKFCVSSDGASVEDTFDDHVDVAAVNPEYGFLATRGAQEDAFSLKLTRRDKLTSQVDSAVRDYIEPFLFASFEILGRKMHEFAKSPHFILESMDVDESGGTAKIRFRYEPLDPDRDTALRSGEIVFLTGSAWSIKTFDCKTFWGTVKGEVDYLADTSVPVPSRFRVESRGENSVVTVDTYEMQSFDSVGQSDCRLRFEDYGITPGQAIVPVRNVNRPVRWTFVVVNAVVIALLLVAYKVLRRREQGRS